MQKKKNDGLDLVTKTYFGVRITELEEALDIKLALQKDEIITEVGEMITQAHSKLYTRIDPLLKEIVDNREDREIGTQKVRDLEIRLNSHDRRIKKLETS